MSVTDIDWTKCAAVETVPGRRGGQPVIVHSRVRPEELIGPSDISIRDVGDISIAGLHSPTA
jgi:uncharacterized protein (DUF433 family)